MFSIQFDNSNVFKKDLKSLNKNKRKKLKIKEILQELAINPFKNFLDIKRLQPKSDDRFRLKIKEYRIIYSIDMGNKIIIVHRIGLRKNIYKK